MPDQIEINRMSVNVDDIKDELKSVTFRLNNGIFGVDVSQVATVYTTKKITPIPNAPIHVMGVINLRGQIITIIDLKKRLQLGEMIHNGIENEEIIILVIDIGDKRIGMAVDNVENVITIPLSKIETRIDLISKDIHSFFLRGVAKVSDEYLVVLLNLNAVMSEYEVDQLAQMQTTVTEDVFNSDDEIVLTDEEIKRLDLINVGGKATSGKTRNNRSKKKDDKKSSLIDID
ncbi:MAG: chemotaxis protein CheW [Candidatus Hodarchaeales archaeon]|jgi:purine-binding chemotaxis protein CheW